MYDIKEVYNKKERSVRPKRKKCTIKKEEVYDQKERSVLSKRSVQSDVRTRREHRDIIITLL